MAVEWLGLYGTCIRLEGDQAAIDEVLRSMSVSDRIVDLRAYVAATDNCTMETHP